MTAHRLLSVAALAMCLAVGAGAFGAHGLRSQLTPDLLAIWQTAVQYHAWHALGLLAIGMLLLRRPGQRALMLAAWLLLAGIVLFSGSLYVLALTGTRGLGLVTPAGGVAFLCGWVALAWGCWQAGDP
jgi:uncharacterized membrane protein YgdD (TMEM256/DUF423 family)